MDRQLRRFILSLFCLLVFSGCSRPLTDAERTFANDLFGPSLDTSKVRVTYDVGITPLYQTVPTNLRLVVPTENACVRTPQPFGAQPPQAFALGNRLHFASELYSSDMLLQWPERMRVPHAIIFAHELVHAWQWQNRAQTRYHPLRAVAESLSLADPYFSEGNAEFFSYGYEQQAAIVEDYVCFTFANPTHPRRQELREILEPVLPIDAFDAALGR